MSKQKVKLIGNDSALILREDGTLDLFIPNIPEDEVNPPLNVLLLTSITILIRDGEFVDYVLNKCNQKIKEEKNEKSKD